MTNSYMKRYSISLIIKKNAHQNHNRYHLTCVENDHHKKDKEIRVGKELKKRNMRTADRNANWCNYYESI